MLSSETLQWPEEMCKRNRNMSRDSKLLKFHWLRGQWKHLDSLWSHWVNANKTPPFIHYKSQSRGLFSSITLFAPIYSSHPWHPAKTQIVASPKSTCPLFPSWDLSAELIHCLDHCSRYGTPRLVSLSFCLSPTLVPSQKTTKVIFLQWTNHKSSGSRKETANHGCSQKGDLENRKPGLEEVLLAPCSSFYAFWILFSP